MGVVAWCLLWVARSRREPLTEVSAGVPVPETDMVVVVVG